MFRSMPVLVLLVLLGSSAATAQPSKRGAFRVPNGEVLLYLTEHGDVVGVLPGSSGRILPAGLELTKGTAVVAWSGEFTYNRELLPCDKARCQQTLGDETPDAVAVLHRILLLRWDLPLDLAQIEQELKKEEAAFTETGVVSVEAGSVCLDSTGADTGGVSGIENPQTQVEKTPATLRVKVKFK